MKKHTPEPVVSDYFDPDTTFDSMLDELDQIDLLDEDVQRLGRRSMLLKCITVALLAVTALFNRHAPVWLDATVLVCVAAFWVADALFLRRRRLELQLQRDILKGAPLAPDLQIRTLQELYPARRMHYPACFFAREVFGFYCPFLVMGLLLTAFSVAQIS